MAKFSYLDVFSSSPFDPLQRHMRKVNEVVKLMEKSISDVLSGDEKAVHDNFAKIQQLEKEADEIKRETFASLPRGIFTPIARGDLVNLVYLQDDIANEIEQIVGRMTISQKRFLSLNQYQDLMDTLTDFSSRILLCIGMLAESVESFDELITSGFSGREANRVQDVLKTLEDAEDDVLTARLEALRQVEKIRDGLAVADQFAIHNTLQELSRLFDTVRSFSDEFQLMLVQS